MCWKTSRLNQTLWFRLHGAMRWSVTPEAAASFIKSSDTLTWKNLSIRSLSIPVHSLLKVCRKLSRYKNSAGNSTSSSWRRVQGFDSSAPAESRDFMKLTAFSILEAVEEICDLAGQFLLEEKCGEERILNRQSNESQGLLQLKCSRVDISCWQTSFII